MKSQKSNVCYQHIGKCLALVFCRTVFVSWWRVYLLASSCLNWCLVEHSSVKNTETLARLSFSRPTSCHTPLPLLHSFPHHHLLTLPTPSKSTRAGACKDVYNVFISFLCEKFRTLSPLSSVVFPSRSLCKVYITMVLFYTILCNLPL